MKMRMKMTREMRSPQRGSLLELRCAEAGAGAGAARDRAGERSRRKSRGRTGAGAVK